MDNPKIRQLERDKTCVKIKTDNYDKTKIKSTMIIGDCFVFQIAPTGGEGGIRTPDTRKGITVFETAAFNRSATSPIGRVVAFPGRISAGDRGIAPP